MLNLNSLAASPCVISFFLVFFNATSRSLSTWVISSCPSCIPKAWGCQDDISTLLKDDILILLPHLCHLCHLCHSGSVRCLAVGWQAADPERVSGLRGNRLEL